MEERLRSRGGARGARIVGPDSRGVEYYDCLHMTRPIPFRRIPHQSALFLDYVELAAGAIGYYARPPRIESVLEAARQLGRGAQSPRAEIASILLRQNLALDNGAAREP